MQSFVKHCVLLCVSLATLVVAGGCSAGGPTLGGYGDSPIETKPKLGISTFQTEPEKDSMISTTARGEYAADVIAEMLGESGRFECVRRKTFASMLHDQNKTDMFKNGVFVQPGKIDGVNCVLTGNITGLSIKKEAKPLSFTQKVSGMFSKAASKRAVDVTVNCNVGLHIIMPTAGDDIVSNNSQFTFTGPAKSLGIDLMESSAKMGDLPVTEDDRNSVIRYAIDDAIKKSLEKIDRVLQDPPPGLLPATAAPTSTTPPVEGAATGGSTATTAPPAPTQPPPPAQAMKKCPACGTLNDPSATICKTCGGNL